MSLGATGSERIGTPGKEVGGVRLEECSRQPARYMPRSGMDSTAFMRMEEQLEWPWERAAVVKVRAKAL